MSKLQSGGGLWEGMYRLVMRRTPVYVTFVIGRAFVGERAVDHGIRAIWDHVNVGKRYEDISVLGQRVKDEQFFAFAFRFSSL